MNTTNGQYRTILRKAICSDFTPAIELIKILAAADIKFETINGNTYENDVFAHINQTIAQGDIAMKKFLSTLSKARPDKEIYRLSIEEMEPYHILDVVIIAMTKIEARDLPSTLGKDCQLFNHLQEIMPFWNTCLSENYGIQREDWKPYGQEAETIKEIFDDGIRKINETRARKNMKEIKLQYSDDSYFQDEHESRDRIWEILRQRGCILVIDSFSLFHPHLPTYIKDAEIITQDKTNIIVLHGDMALAKQMNLWIEELLKKYVNRPKIFERFNGNDHRCDIGIKDKRNLQRWLYSVVSTVFDPREVSDIIADKNDSKYPQLWVQRQ